MTLRHVNATIVAVEELYILHILSVCVNSDIQHVKRKRRTLCSSVACLAVPHYFINGSIFGKKILNMKCVFRCSLQRLSEIFLFIRRSREILSDMYISLHVKYPLFLLHFN